MTEGNLCMGHREYEDVLDAATAGAVRSRGPDGHRTDGRRLLSTLLEVRHHGTGARNVRRSTTSAVGAGGARPEKVVLSCSRWGVRFLVTPALAAKQEGTGGPVEKGATTATRTSRSTKTNRASSWAVWRSSESAMETS
jgi:hypothetical protein